MTASPADQATLLDLQLLDNRLSQIVRARAALPQVQQLRELHAQHGDLRRALAQARGEADDATAELKRVESDVAVVEARILRDTQRLTASSSVREVQGLEHELGSLRKRLNDLEEIELTVMERVEQSSAALATLQHEGEQLHARAAALGAEREAALADLDAEATTLTDNRAALVGSLPADLVELYERQRARYGVGAALLRRGVSEGSNMALTESDLADIRRAAPETVVLDPESGCILVRTAESGL